MQSKDGEKAGSDIGLHIETSPVHEASFGSCQDRPSPDRERLPGPLSPAAKGSVRGCLCRALQQLSLARPGRRRGSSMSHSSVYILKTEEAPDLKILRFSSSLLLYGAMQYFF